VTVGSDCAAPALDAFAAHVERSLARDTGAGVRILEWQKLAGGAIQQNIAARAQVDAGPWAGRHRWVVRTDAPSGVAVSHSREQEFALLSVAHRAGVRVPRPLWCHAAVDGLPSYFVMEHVEGIAAGHRLTKGGAIPDAAALTRDLAVNLACLHGIVPPAPGLEFLGAPPASPAGEFLGRCREYLDHWHATIGTPQPVLEWALRYCAQSMPPAGRVCLLHHDYRTGNFLVAEGRLAAVLDWEFAGWGDPLEDIGWLFARCWRFARPDRIVGGIGDPGVFLDAYNASAGTCYAELDTRYWQLVAHLRWSVIALQQAERHLSGREPSLELALTGRILPELELEMLNLVHSLERSDG
jgi:aminoglycoside phosphotransferase (APT) family kinase protein